MTLDFLLFQKLLIALLLGALIGLEREHAVKEEEEEFHFAGIRTFALFSFVGALGQIFFRDQPVFLWLLSGGIFSLIIAAYVMSSLRTKTVGATTELAAFGVYFIGIITGQGEFFMATALTLLILIILHFKNPLHKLAHRISKEELTSTVKFMIIAFVILPLLPNKTYGPFDVLNPSLIWLMVVFVSGISFASYLGVKFLGKKKGIGFTGFLAGFVSSTALTLSYSNESKKHPSIVNPFVFAIVLASSAMFFRLIVELGVLNPALLKKLILPLSLMGVTGCLLAFSYWRKKERSAAPTEHQLKKEAEKLESPFTLRPALKFAVLFGVILFLSKAAAIYFGTNGLYATSFFSAIFDVDAITVSLAKLAPLSIPEDIATKAILLAAATNTLSKGALFFLLGNRVAARSILMAFLVILVVGAVSFFAVA